MGARLVWHLADLWWRLTGKPVPWTWRERREAVRGAEAILQTEGTQAPGSASTSTGSGE